MPFVRGIDTPDIPLVDFHCGQEEHRVLLVDLLETIKLLSNVVWIPTTISVLVLEPFGLPLDLGFFYIGNHFGWSL